MKNESLIILTDQLNTIDIHFKRIDYIADNISTFLPFTASAIENTSCLQQVFCDVLLYRFTHLQYTMTVKVLPRYLEVTEKLTHRLSFIDELNLLERLGIIESISQWKDLKDLRNTLSCEYYFQSAFYQADVINQVWHSLPMIRACAERIKQRIALLSL